MGRISVEEFRAADKMPLTVVLDDVRSMYNIGSVFRTSDAFRVEQILLCGITACPPHPEIHKTALGAEDTVAWQHFASTMDAVNYLHEQGYTVFSIEQCEGSTKLQDLAPSILPQGGGQASGEAASVKSLPLGGGQEGGHSFAIILGNEVKGVKQEVVDASDGCLEIPQFGTKHSLNVSTTAGMVIWEFAKILKPELH